MKNRRLLPFIILLMVLGARLTRGAVVAEVAKQIAFSGGLGRTMPLEAVFDGGDGVARPFGSFLDGRPVILTFGYSRCLQLCSEVNDGLARSLKMTSLTLGKDYDVISICIDPNEKPQTAYAAKQRYAALLAGSPERWIALTGGTNSIALAASTAGFVYASDPGSGQFAHAAGVAILTPKGVVSRYLYGIDFSPSDLTDALRTAKAGQTRRSAKELLLLCFQLGGEGNARGVRIISILRAGAAAMALGMAGFIGSALYRERKHGAPGKEGL